MGKLEGKVAVVAGASRGAGRGIALGLGEAGATVYAVGRTSRQGPAPADGAPGTVEETAEEVTARGGTGIAVRADCTSVDDVKALFERVDRERGRVDVVANAVWGMSDAFPTMEDSQKLWSQPFWEQPATAWRDLMGSGPEAYFLVTREATLRMAAAGRGLVVAVTDGILPKGDGDATAAAASPEPGGPLLWDLAHATINRMMRAIALEGKPHGISAVTLMPGFMQTERVVRLLTTPELKKMFRFDLSESTLYLGRAVAALAKDPHVKKKSGRIHFVADLAREYGFTDADGRLVPRFDPHR